MKKLDRLAGILLYISNQKKITAEQLAETLEVSVRTIYRDIQSLSELGVPIIAEKGVDGGYSLMENYHLKPVMLTEAEAEAVFLGCNFISRQEGFPLASEAKLALKKLASVLPVEQKSQGEAILEKINFNLPVDRVAKEYAHLLEQIKRAIAEKKKIEIHYRSLKSETVRKIDPYELTYQNNAWYINGYCHLRGELRQFKVVRIKKLLLTDEEFIEVNDVQKRVNIQSDSEEEEVVVLIKKDTSLAVAIREDIYYKNLLRKEDARGLYLHFKQSEYSFPYLCRILLSFGDQAQVLKPASFQKKYRRQLKKILKIYD